MAERTLVAAATDLLARGYQVVPTDRRSPQGQPVNGLFAVARGIVRAVAFKTPARAVAVLSEPRSDWPELLTQQLPELEGLLRTLGLHVVRTDDEPRLVAAYAHAALEAGDDVVVVGVDKRFAQLVSDQTWWYDANKDARYTPEMVRKRFGVPSEQVAEWLALVGEEDVLPGVAGIGAKGATQLLETYGSVEKALASVDDIRGRTGNALRAAGGDAIRAEVARSRLTSTVALPLALAQATYAPQPSAAANALFERLGFAELLVPDTAETPVDVVTSAEALARFGTAPVALAPLIDEGDRLTGLGLSTGDGPALYVADPPSIAGWLADPSRPKLAHAREGLLVALAKADITLAGFHGDSAAASHLTQPSNWAPHDLALVAKHVLGRALDDEDSVRGVGNQQKAWANLDPRAAARHAGAQADAIAGIWRALSPHLDAALLTEYRELSDTLVRMELTGITIDRHELDGAERDFARIEEQLEADIASHAGGAFNINSSKQLGAVLFDQLKLPVVSHTKTGWSTANEALERIEYAHPIVALVLRWRLLRRLRDSWLISLRNCIQADGRIHSRFHPARSFSGRLVNTLPDLSRVPGRTPEMARVRRAFVAAPGHLLVSIDYSQLGLHVLAHLTRDPALVEPLRERRDLHALTASAVLEVPLEQLTPDQRQLGKVVNFATFAGQGSSALAMQLGVSAPEAKALIARFDARYSKVRAFQDEQLAQAKARGYVVTLAGRRWPIGGLESLDSHDRSYAERLARRATHEGSVCDLARRGLLDADKALRREGLRSQPLALILDEVLFEMPEAELDQAARLASEAMLNAFAPLEVPLKVGIEAGPNWADLQPLQTS